MTLWRTFVRWLARKDLAAAEIARQELARAVYSVAAQAEALERTAFAHGELVGQQRMLDCIQQAVAARMGGGDDMVTPEDLARAKRGQIH